jgi:GMP reductase
MISNKEITSSNKFLSQEVKLNFADVMICPRTNSAKSRQDIKLDTSFSFHSSPHKLENVIPIMASNMDTIGTFDMANALAKYHMLTCIHKYYTIPEWQDFINLNEESLYYTIVTSGISDNDFNRLEQILSLSDKLKIICLDVANGHSTNFHEKIKKVRKAFPDHIIIAGNCVTAECVKLLAEAGADIVKVGIGSGSLCLTKYQTGVSYPLFNAILDIYDTAKELGVHIIADGGISIPGDICKSYGAGASFVMLGGLLSFCNDVNNNDIIIKDGIEYKRCYGMSSNEANNKYNNGLSNYKASEGKCVNVKCNKSIHEIIGDITGSLRSFCTYINATQLNEIYVNCQFVKVYNQKNLLFDKH